ncbi:hypothetical protein EG328_004057 [Venturia inaequalis]|uniref:DUF8040 domain-containing protein n=2 Tax=Venturia inaequalis TaxID=5025 RepID=A0A8H3UR92_VENIN|nr:hypothetical protein EG328_004057 [Venturia inaequalis]
MEEEVLKAWWENREPMYEDHYYANTRIKKLLAGHPSRLFTRKRMTHWQFKSLAKWLEDDCGLTASKYAEVDTKRAIFIHICGQGATFRDASKYWEVSGSQVSKFFHEVLDALVLLSLQNITMYEVDEAVAVAKNKRKKTVASASDSYELPLGSEEEEVIEDGNGDSSSNARFPWSECPRVSRALIELAQSQTMQGLQNGIGFKTKGWNNIIDALNTLLMELGLVHLPTVDKDIVQSRWQTVKRKWKV